MAVTSTPVFVQTPKITPITIVPADTTTSKTAATAGSNGSKVIGMTITSTDTSARVIQISLTRSATNYLLATVNVPAASGTDGSTAVVNCFNPLYWPGLPIDTDGNPFLFLVSGDTLTIATTVTVTTAKTVTCATIQGDF